MNVILTTLRGLLILVGTVIATAFLPLTLGYAFGHRVGVVTFAAELVLVAAWVVGKVTSKEGK